MSAVTGKVHALEFEALTLSTEFPIPIPLPLSAGLPINPTVFPANWEGEISIETRWRTDVTRPKGSNRTERWSLATRPSRRLRAKISGLSKDESHALLQAAFRHTDAFGAPVPLYPDAVNVTSAAGVVIQGDFRRRRFFTQGRVVVFPLTHSTKKSDNTVFHATIQEITPTSCTIDAAPRTITSRDVVIPCIDTELLTEASGTAHTDTVWETEMEWNEVEGASTLPALWPPCVPGNAEILSPICEILDDLPIFPFDPNWGAGIEITPTREIDSDSVGRSNVQNADGLPFHVIRMTLQGYDRERSWNILRFFDSMRGRAGDFYLIHPLRPWTFNAVPAVDRVWIKAVGDREAVIRYFRRVVLTRADGTKVSRYLNNVADLGDRFSLVFSVNLPDTAFVDVQPIMVCNFDSDSIEEGWATTEIAPALELTINENPDPGNSSATNQTELQFGPVFPAFLGIEGLNLLFRAGNGCVRDDGQPSCAWPGDSRVARWEDTSPGPARQQGQVVVQKSLVDTSGSEERPHLIRFPQSWENNKQLSIVEPTFNLPFQTSALTPASQKRLWSSDGWTMVICFSPTWFNYTPSNRYLARIETPAGMVFSLRIDSVGAGYAFRAGVQAKDASGTLASLGFNRDLYNPIAFPGAVFLTVRVSSSDNRLRVWVNGQQALAGAMVLTGGLWTTQDYTVSNWFDGLTTGNNEPSASFLRDLFGKFGCANLLVSYDRPLDIDDVNALHVMVADMFRTTVAVSTIYA